MHTHMSLFEGDMNAFYEEGAQYQLSRVGRQFIAGLLRHANEISAVTNQFVNSYKRLWGGDEAPSFICWGHNNRSALVRVPLYKPNKGQSSRVEYRALDSAANPYLAYALMLSAGLKGIEEEYELPAEAEDNVRSEEHTSELQSLMRISYAVFCLKKKNIPRSLIIGANTPISNNTTAYLHAIQR